VTDGTPQILLVDGAYQDYSLERHVFDAAGARFISDQPRARTEEDVLSARHLANADVLLVELAPITGAVLRAATRCRAVVRYGTGLDNIDIEAAKQLQIAVLNVADYAADSVADHVVALMLVRARQILQAVDVVRSGKWRGDDPLRRPLGLRDRVLGLMGCGAIGGAVAARAQAFGMKVNAYDPFLSAEKAPAGVGLCSWDQLLQESDVISLHVPLTEQTRHVVNADALAQMKPTAILINTARGGLVDEAALLDAVTQGRIDFAALDVCDLEPPLANSELRDHPRILLTPHIGFWSDQSEHELRARVANLAVAALGLP
jgi:D-3-phosphoglycerate dehydrogenase